MLETKEDRLKKYQDLSESKSSSVSCPVCNQIFTNKYSLSNHFMVRGYKDGIRYIDSEHEKYWVENKKRQKRDHKKEVLSRTYTKICLRCGDSFPSDYDHRFAKQCPVCREKYPPKVKKPQKEMKDYPCFRCGKIIRTKRSASNTVCGECRVKERHKKIQKMMDTPLIVECPCCGKKVKYFKKHLRDRCSRIFCAECSSDPFRFKKHPKYDSVIFLLETTTLTRREIKELLSLEIDFVREAAIEKFGEEWYQGRVKFIRNRAGPLHGLSNKKFFDELRKDRKKLEAFFINRSRVPSSLEILFVSMLKDFMKYSQNQWITLFIDHRYERREIDLKVVLGNTGRKFAILIDGEAFHGEGSYFQSVTPQKEAQISQKLANMGYFSIRYSESEVKSGWANKHFARKYFEFQENPPKYYYRNWMTKEEVYN